MSLQLDRRSEELRLRVVRRALRHDSSPKHVAGTATFVDDMREPEGLLHVAVGGAPIAAGQLLGIDLDAVRTAPGVVAVLTAADIPGKNDVGPVLHDDPVFVDGRIEFHGQVAFAVVRQSRAWQAPASRSRWWPWHRPSSPPGRRQRPSPASRSPCGSCHRS